MPKQGQVKLHTGDGSIHVSNLKGNMELDSGDGSLEVEVLMARSTPIQAMATSMPMAALMGWKSKQVTARLIRVQKPDRLSANRLGS